MDVKGQRGEEEHSVSVQHALLERATVDGAPTPSRPVPELDHFAIALRIREGIHRAGMTNLELADVMQVHRNTIGLWTRQADPVIPWNRLGELASVLGVTKEWLLHGEEVPLAPLAQTELAELRAAVEQLRRLLEARLPEPPTPPESH